MDNTVLPFMLQPAYLERFPRFYHSKKFEAVKKFVRSDLFEKIVIGMLLVNLVAVIIESTLDIENSSNQGTWQNIEFALGRAIAHFSVLYGVYLIIKILWHSN
jgi:two pore calcium channel protein